MCADEQAKLRFEPPPWEREAFERFQKERAEREAAEAALAAARQAAAELEAPAPTEPTADSSTPAPTVPDVLTAITSVPGGVTVSLGAPVRLPEAPVKEPAATTPAIPEAQIQAMLIELRGQEPLPIRTNMPLVNTVIGVFALLGVYIGAQALIWLAKGGDPGAPDFMLRAAASFLVFLAGAGFVAGAILLYRKYHR